MVVDNPVAHLWEDSLVGDTVALAVGSQAADSPALVRAGPLALADTLAVAHIPARRAVDTWGIAARQMAVAHRMMAVVDRSLEAPYLCSSTRKTGMRYTSSEEIMRVVIGECKDDPVAPHAGA
jgi:hypothetical protein